VVRVFAASDDATDAVVAARLKAVLDSAQAHHLFVIVSLTDFYVTGMFPKGDAAAYTGNYNGLALLGTAWFQGGFRTRYLPWVREVVGRYAAHPAIFAWELGTSCSAAPTPRRSSRSPPEVGQQIRSLDTRHLIATGMITAAWLSMAQARRLYGLSTVDVITVHDYDAAHLFDDSWLSNELGKPMIIEEAGFDSGTGPHAFDADITWWVGGKVGARVHAVGLHDHRARQRQRRQPVRNGSAGPRRRLRRAGHGRTERRPRGSGDPGRRLVRDLGPLDLVTLVPSPRRPT